MRYVLLDPGILLSATPTTLLPSSALPRIRTRHPFSAAMSALQRFLAATSSTLPRQCATAGVLFATGDTIAQQFVEKKGSRHDIVRTLRLSAYGGLIFAPIASTWFGKVLERVQFKSAAANVVTKVRCLDFSHALARCLRVA